MRVGIVAIALLSSAIMPAAARDLDAKFLIERKGKVIGVHEVDVEPLPYGTRVDTRVRMKVALGPITLFSYNHKATEIWRDGELISLVSATDNNGEANFVDAKRYGDALMIKGTAYEGPAPEGAMPSSYWDKDLVNAETLINTQTGELIDVKTTKLGKTPAPNQRIADHYRLVGTLALNLWYDDERWIGSNFTIDGEELTYVLVEDEREFASLDGAGFAE